MSDEEETSVVSNDGNHITDVHWNDLIDVQHVYAVNEFERQVFGRINAQGFAGKQLAGYILTDEEKGKLDQELIKAESQVTHIKKTLSWDTKNYKKRKKQRGTTGDCTTHSIECDFYVQLTKVNGNSGTVSLRSILLDVAEDIQQLNESSSAGRKQDVMLETDDLLWMEIAETPQSLRNKLLQLERAYRLFKENNDKLLPRVAVVCLNGEKGKFDAAVRHLRELSTKGDLSKWEILKSEVPVFVTYTPYRNVYGSMRQVTTDMIEVKSAMKTMAKKSDIAEVKSEMNQMKYLLLVGLAAIFFSQMRKK